MSWAMVLAGLLTASTPARDCWRFVWVDGMRRSYLVHIPRVEDRGQPLPVVLAFHGGGRHAKEMADLTGLNHTADSGKFIVVYPNGSGWLSRVRTWNAGIRCGYAVRHEIDEVKFVDGILRDLAHVTSVDSKRIYATGISNGAMLCYRLAAEMPERIAAIAPVAGTFTSSQMPDAPGVSVVHFHGTEDQNVPFAGGVGSRSLTKTDYPSVDRCVRAWVAANGCRTEPEVEELPMRVDDGTRVTRTAYRSDIDQAEVVLYTIHGGGHTWPGGKELAWYTGRTSRNISANDVMWEFFVRHPKRSTSGASAAECHPESAAPPNSGRPARAK